jgi:hypothetical protein
MTDIDYYRNREKKILRNIDENPDFISDFSIQLELLLHVLVVYEMLHGSIEETKKLLNTCGVIDVYQIEKFNSRLFDYSIPNVCYAILSDNPELYKRYADVRYQKGSNSNYTMDEMVADGEVTIFCHSIQMIMKQDWAMLERNLNLIETITLPKKTKSPELMRLDFEFYRAIYEKDKPKCEEVLEKLVSPKIHKKRNDSPLLAQYISMPAAGYAKLAWVNGLEVQVNTPLIPKAMLPVSLCENYEIRYDFLKGIL